MDQDYGIEQRLYDLSPELHRRYRGCLIVAVQMLNKYQHIFPFYTDHTILHSMDVLALCNILIGEQIERLTAEDLYVLMMGALFHDIGMGVSESDYKSFSTILSLPVATSEDERADLIRDNHQELSALFMKKYGPLFDIPNSRYLDAIIQVCRGHRRTDLMNENEYPSYFMVEEGKNISLPYLACLICLADELDIARDRNISLLYDIDDITNKISHMEFEKHEAVSRVEIEEERVIIHAGSNKASIRTELDALTQKLQDKLLLCKKVADEHTGFTITQNEVLLKIENEPIREDA